MTPKQSQINFNTEFQKQLKSTLFPDDMLPLADRLDNIKHYALQYESPISLAMPFHEYKVFVMKKNGYTLFEAAQLFNVIERRTPGEMGNVDYYEVQEEVYKAGERWKTLTNPIRESIDKKIMIMANNIGGQMRPTKLIKA